MRRLLGVLAIALVIGFGLLTLIGLLTGRDSGIVYDATMFFLQITAITLGVAVLIGLLNLYNVHIRRVVTRGRGLGYSIVLLVAASLVLILWLTGQDASNRALLETVQVALESALGGLVFFALVYGAYRLMRRGVTVSGIVFTIVLLIVLLGALPGQRGDTMITSVRAWLLSVPVSAGERGLLLGIALATVVTGVRVLAGQDRNLRD